MSATETKLHPGMVLAKRYRLDEEIGRGGFGMVYRARQLNMDREVALKILPPKFMAVSDVVERFRREARLASRLQHPNTITVHDYGRHENLLFIVMEMLAGEDLADVLAKTRTLAMERILHIGRQVLKSLHDAHSHKIVHRDLKPENIFLTQVGGESDFVKVLDFGIAKMAMPEMTAGATGAGRRLTQSGSTVGTPTYMSPEQAAGEEVDALTDLYALAVIMYETACGRPPFYDESAAKVMRNHLFTAVPKFGEEPLRNSRFEYVLLKALSKEKEHRYASAQEFLEALSPSAAEMLRPYDYADEPPTTEFFGLDDPSEVLESDGPGLDISSSSDVDLAAAGLDAPRQKRTTESMLQALEDTLNAGDSAADAAIPFDSLPADTSRARVQEGADSSGRNQISGLIDARPRQPSLGDHRPHRTSESNIFADAPPTGFESNTSSSSIITALEPEADEVILLTQKKAETPPHTPTQPVGVDSEPAPHQTPPTRPNDQTLSGDLDDQATVRGPAKDEDWSWQMQHGDGPGHQDTPDQLPSARARAKKKKARTRLFWAITALVLLPLLVALGLNMAGIIYLF